jgi:hypothetical protein
MKIVKRGDITRVETWVGTCLDCGTEMEARRHELDVCIVEHESGLGRRKAAKHECPLCAATMWFEKAPLGYTPRPEVW